jgi:hypothetical protein
MSWRDRLALAIVRLTIQPENNKFNTYGYID